MYKMQWGLQEQMQAKLKAKAKPVVKKAIDKKAKVTGGKLGTCHSR